MDNLQKVLLDNFDATLAAEFTNCAYFEPVMDYIEYISADQITVCDRIDQCLTLIYAADSSKVIGFRLKGFRNLFNKLKVVLELREEHFLPLTRVIEQLLTEFGDEICQDNERKHSYKVAFEIARQDDVTFKHPELLAA